RCSGSTTVTSIKAFSGCPTRNTGRSRPTATSRPTTWPRTARPSEPFARAQARSGEGRPRRGAEEPALPLVPHLERVVHPCPRRLERRRYGGGEQTQEGVVVHHPLPQHDLATPTGAVGGLERRHHVEQRVRATQARRVLATGLLDVVVHPAFVWMGGVLHEQHQSVLGGLGRHGGEVDLLKR